MKAKNAEHKEVRKPIEKAEEAEHTGTLMNMSTSLPVIMILRWKPKILNAERPGNLVTLG